MPAPPRSPLLSTLLLALLLAPPAAADVEAIARAKRDLQLSFTVAGQVADVLVEPGDRVEADQPLLRLDDEEIASNLRLLRLRAESTLEMDAAEAEWKMAQADEKRVRSSFAQDAAAEFEVERAELETLRQRLRFELFQQRREEAMLNLRQAEIRQTRYTMRAPMDGVVEEVIIETGEAVDALQPVVRVVVIDPLVVDAPVPTADTLSLAEGDPAWVLFQLPGQTAPIQGRITQVASVADAASETRRVRIEIPNPDALPAGSAVSVFLDPPEPASVNARANRSQRSAPPRSLDR
jgi:multidrug efflux system membrane fusion protein